MRIVSFYILAFILSTQSLYAVEPTEPVNPLLLRKSWPARWISHHEEQKTELSVFHFRKEISFSTIPDSLWIHVSADSRYRLYVNGIWVSHGPAAGDLRHWQFETLNIAPYLRAGKNYVAAEVWNSDKNRAMSHLSFETGFILQEDNLEKPYGLNTDATWLSCRNEGYAAVPQWSSDTDIGPAEMVDFTKYSVGWNAVEVADKDKWKAASEGSHGETKWSIHYRPGRFLVPRSIPGMRMDHVRFASIRKSTGMTVNEHSLQKKRSYQIPANTKVEWLIDQKELTNAYPVVELDRGANAVVKLAYAEALYDESNQKGHRDEVEGKHFQGFQDGIVASGSKISYMPLWYRTFRYLKLSIETKDQPLEITDLYAIKSEYPFDYNASFKADDSSLDSILKIGWRTAKLCAMETYMDCPYYERLQYIGDTRIQGMVSLYNSGDDRLLRQALSQFDQSRMSEGITLSRYPTNYDQQIPPFSLWWIGMVNDYWMYRGDQQFIRSLLPGVRQVLTFFENFQQPDGSLGEMPYWNFTDWSNSKGWFFGAPPNAQKGNSAIMDLQLLWAYQIAAKLERDLGLPAMNDTYQQKITQLKSVIKQKYWSEQKGLFADEDKRELFSQHANVLAILTDLVSEQQSKNLMDRIMTDTSLAQTTIYFRYYQMLALKKVGYADRYLSQLNVWRDHIKSGLTTWAEISDTKSTRSDCHAWGASPNIELYRIVLGIDTDGPGFSKVKIEPALGKLTNASGTIPHQRGALSVSYRQKGAKWQIEIKLPAHVSGNLIWKGKTYLLADGNTNKFTL